MPAGHGSAGLPRVRARRRVAWGLADQILSSASNFLVAFLAANQLSASHFGSFVLALAVCNLVGWLARALASDPLSVAHAADQPDALRTAVRASATMATLVGVLSGVVLAGIGLAFGGDLGVLFLVTALVLPGVTLQDNIRFSLLVAKRPKAMFVNDLVWLVLQLPLLAVVLILGGPPSALLAVWGVAGTVAALIGLRQAGVLPGAPSVVRPWLVRHKTLWPYFALENVVFQATNVALIIIISALATLSEAGGIRAALLLFTPFTVISRGIVSVVVPEFARRAGDPAWVRRRGIVLGLMLVPLTLAWTGLCLLIPFDLGDAVLGDSWQYAEPVVLLVGLIVTVSMFLTGPQVGLRALGAARDGLAARMSSAALVLVVSAVGATWNGAEGALLLAVLVSPLQLGVWIWLLTRASAKAGRIDVQEVAR